jgi:hypothetical protein
MTAEQKIAKITDAILQGKTVYFQTYLKSYAVNLKTLNKFKAAGFELFKVSGNSVLMLCGKKYLCVDGCQITVG